jgi:putative transposase
MLAFCEHTMHTVCDELLVELVEFNGEATTCTGRLHIRAGDLNADTADKGSHREHTGACVRARMRGDLWSPFHFAVSCTGAPLSIITQYIHGQARPV